MSIYCVTAITAIIGVLLGVLNLWKEMNRDKVKFSIIPVFKERLCLFVFVINKSNFPIYVPEIGLKFKGDKNRYPTIEYLEGKEINGYS